MQTMETSENDVSDDGSKERRARLQKELDSLHREMEIAEIVSERGQRRKVVPRKSQLELTRKRKLLEKVDAKQHAISVLEDEGDRTKRLRGAKAALGEAVIQGSLIFGGAEETEDGKSALEETEVDDEDVADNADGLGTYEMYDEVGLDVPTVGEGLGGAGDELLGTASTRNVQFRNDDEGKVNGKADGSKIPASGKKRTRLLYQLRSFRSYRMAQRHGAALGAHARGQPKIAVEKLGEVATDAPAAPQIYSSLGLVYENMLKESTSKSRRRIEPISEDDQQDCNSTNIDSDSQEKESGEDSIAQRLNLAKKAYGSYHIAAVLCKKDFTLWVRAADTAMEISDLHTQGIALSSLTDNAHEEHRQEKKRWIEEARKDYASADNLKPPGIDVAAKLAVCHMELGNLSEALTILTDVKNRGRSASTDQADSSRCRLLPEQSYRVWLLYADLMLRIGHECTQWNRGIEKNDNYMFRRWLRKYSENFDWQERRLQALCLALEAAAGTKSCSRVLEWTEARAKSIGSSDSSSNIIANDRWRTESHETVTPSTSTGIENIADTDGVDDTNDSEDPATVAAIPSDVEEDVSSFENVRRKRQEDPLTLRKQEFEKEKKQLLSSNLSELTAFDNDTESMNLNSGSAAESRSAVREALVKSQKNALVKLVGEFYQDQGAVPPKNHEPEDKLVRPEAPQLPISASCATVCSIASELMKHCLGLELFGTARLVSEAVSSYLKERASLHEKRLESRDAFSQKQQSTDAAVLLQFEPYDEIEVDADDSNDEQSTTNALSDDEDIIESGGGRLLESLRNGTLPPELRVLSAVGLIGEGGRNYVALKSIESVNDLPQEGHEWLEEEDVIDTSLRPDPAWMMFRRAMVDPLQKTAAFAFVTDVLRKTGKEQEWASLLETMFKEHLCFLEAHGLVEQLLSLKTLGTTNARLMKGHLVKVILATARFTLIRSEACVREVTAEKHLKVELSHRAIELASTTISTVTRIQSLLWKVASDGSISSRCVEILNLHSRSFGVLLKAAQESGQVSDADCMSDLLSKIEGVVSLLIGAEVEVGDSAVVDPLLAAESWTEFPLPNGWQSSTQELISKLMFNLCIACAVSRYSGWQTEEFELDRMRKRGALKHFGINLSGEHVLGHISSETEAELLHLWDRIGEMLPWASSFDLESALSIVKDSEWYKTTKARVQAECKNDHDQESIATHGERDGIRIFLMFSNLCLLTAATPRAEGAIDALLKTALSIVLPMTQFCVNQNIWQSPIGRAAARKSCGEAWSHFSQSNSRNQDTAGGLARYQAKPQPKPVVKRLGKQLGQATKVVNVSAFLLLGEWMEGAVDTRVEEFSESAQKAMQKVDELMSQLRTCFTVSALQKCCIQVAVALLDLVSQGGHCSNPFLCLQQAVVFASQGSKGGSNDEHFKEVLPPERDCTPLKALTIIGRADCLQALDFPNEAMFLCSYVARVCSLHRDREKDDTPWSPQWRVVGVSAYNVRVSIDSTIRSLTNRDSGRKVQLEPWDKNVLEELDRGRADAIALRSSLTYGEDDGSDSSPTMASNIDSHLSADVDNFASLEKETEVRVESDDDTESEKIPVVAV